MATPDNSSIPQQRATSANTSFSAGRNSSGSKNTPLPPKNVIINTKFGKIISSLPVFTYTTDELPDLTITTDDAGSAAQLNPPATSETAPLSPTTEVPTSSPPSAETSAEKPLAPAESIPEGVIPSNKPNIQIHNYKYVNNKLLILLNVDQGENVYLANNFSQFTPEQIASFGVVIKNKGLSYSEGLIFSKSLNNETYFLIYRTEIKPQSYADIIIAENIIKQLNINLSETSFDDKIQPNRKYYYCFQIVDKFGVHSDASLVYEIEMIDQSGTVYLSENVFKPEKKVQFIKEKEFESEVKIKPSEAQINVPEILEPQYDLVFSKTKLPTLSVSYRFDVIQLQNELGYLLPYLVELPQNVAEEENKTVIFIPPIIKGLSIK